MSEHVIPSLGTTAAEIYRAWEAADAAPGERVVGLITGEGKYGWLHGELVRLFDGRGGTPPTYEPQNSLSLAVVGDALERGLLQIQREPIPNRTYGMPYGYGVTVLHQATGRPLAEYVPTWPVPVTGDTLVDLVAGAAEAIETFSEDELEAYANAMRREVLDLD
jgi:hypothetical protein